MTNKNNKKVIVAIFFSVLMIAGMGLVLFQGNSNNANNINNISNSVNTGTNNSFGVSLGATNSGLIVPESKLGNGTGLGNSLTTASFDGDATISSDGSTYGVISGTDTLQFNTTISLTSGFIGYNIAIKSGAHVTLSGMIINEMDNGQGYNNYTIGQLNLSNDKIHGQSGVAMHNCISADYTNSSFIYGNAKIEINHGVNDVFYQNAQVIIGGTTSGDIFNYGSSPTLNNLTIVNDVSGGGLITDSYFNNTAITITTTATTIASASFLTSISALKVFLISLIDMPDIAISCICSISSGFFLKSFSTLLAINPFILNILYFPHVSNLYIHNWLIKLYY